MKTDRLPNFPELLEKQQEITTALADGKTPEGILFDLRGDGVVTTEARVRNFCEALEVTLELALLPIISQTSRFEELEASRATVVKFMRGGCSPLETWAGLTKCFNVPSTQQRVATYLDLLIHELYPPGPIQKSLFEVRATGQFWDNDAMVLSFGEGEDTEIWTVGDFSEGVGIFGGTGSGKTSGSGRTIAVEFLKHGYGGLVLTTKQSEVEEWMGLAGACDRGEDVSVVCPEGLLRLNLLQYEMERPGPGANLTENFVDFFKNLLSVMSSHKGQVVNQNFWQITGEQLLRNLVNCFLLAKETLTLDRLCEFVAAAPTREDQAKADKWPTLGVFGEVLGCAQSAANDADDMRVYGMLEQYWLKAYPTLAPETRSCITIAFTAMLDALRARHVYDLLSTYTSITPEAIFDGRIVILSLPVNEYQGAGVLVQAAWKYLFERAVLRRPDKRCGGACRPVFLWEDECQNFLIDFDAEFQSRARDCRVARVMLTQNLNCLYERFGGGEVARSRIHAILGNLNTKLFHANSDTTTNKWASELAGTAYTTVPGRSVTQPQYPGLNPFMEMVYRFLKEPIVTDTTSTIREPVLHPHDFVSLMTGGPKHDYMVEAIAMRAGRPFINELHSYRVAFRQFSLPNGTSSQN